MLVNRGRPSTYIKPAIFNNKVDLLKINDGKIGHPYVYSEMLIVVGFAIKSVFKIGYREAAGMIKDYAELAGSSCSPDFRTIQWRISRMESDGIKFMIYAKNKILDVVIDSSEVKSTNYGEYRRTKYDRIKMWEKIHIAVDRKTHKILNIIVTGNEIGDPREFIPLLDPIEKANIVRSATADGVYDSEKNFKYCDDNNINSLIPVHINATGESGRHRRKHVVEQLGVIRKRGWKYNRIPPKKTKRMIQEQWKNNSGYHGRSLVESAISVFKNAFGEYTFSKSKNMRGKELLLKAVVYNRFLT